MTNLNNFVFAAESFVRLNPTKSTTTLTTYISDRLDYLKEHRRTLLYSTYNVALLNAIAQTEDYSLEAVNALVAALPASDDSSSMERIRGLLASINERKADYILKDIQSIANGTSGSNQTVLDATFEFLVNLIEVKHGELNSQWTGKDLEPLLG